jgi:hypothetical protein
MSGTDCITGNQRNVESQIGINQAAGKSSKPPILLVIERYIGRCDEAVQILHSSNPSDLDIGSDRRRDLVGKIENHQCSGLVRLESFRGKAITKLGGLVMFVDPPNQPFTPGTKVGGLARDRFARSTGRQIPRANEIEMTCQTDDTTRSLDFESGCRFWPRPDF